MFWWPNVCFFVQLENFSLVWRRQLCRWRVANFDSCSALMAIEQWGFFNVPHRDWDSNTQPSACEANALTHCAIPWRWPYDLLETNQSEYRLWKLRCNECEFHWLCCVDYEKIQPWRRRSWLERSSRKSCSIPSLDRPTSLKQVVIRLLWNARN